MAMFGYVRKWNDTVTNLIDIRKKKKVRMFYIKKKGKILFCGDFFI
jgi:hypothetical protein